MSSESGREPRSDSRRGLIFAALVAACAAVGVGFVIAAAIRGDSGAGAGADLGEAGGPGRVVFQHLADGAGSRGYAKVAIAPADDPSNDRKLTDLTCERIYFAGRRGLCLVAKPNPVETSYEAIIVGRDFRPSKKLSLAGIPSRARVSPDGRYGATTAFVAGHSYLDSGFSTRTVLLEMRSGALVADVEKDFRMSRRGKPFKRMDFNYWGVTFKRSGQGFFATLRTGGTTYLIEADIGSRSGRVLHENVECPSLSPDETRIAYKKRLGQGWRLHVLELETMRETALAETQSVDDQVEWLNDKEILYGLSGNVWAVSADGSGAPRPFITSALSPAVLRN